MKWNDLDNLNVVNDIYDYHRVRTDIECPECGNMVYRRTDIVLTSIPPKYQYECQNCGWVGFSKHKR